MGVLVSGMHRSGTSMLAQWVNELGAGAGDGPLYAANHANPRGLFERRDVVDFNDRWLALLGGSWWAPPNVKEQTWRSIDSSELERCRTALDVFHPDHNSWFVKDPRLSLLLPLWDRLALQRLPILIGLREPRDVAMSLNVRSGTSLRRGLALWIAYNREIFGHLAGRRSLVVDLTSGFEDSGSAVKAVGVFLAGQDMPVADHDIHRTGSGVESYLRRHRCSRLEGYAEHLARDLDDVYRTLAERHLLEEDGSSVDLPIPEWAREALDELNEFWDAAIKADILEGELKAERRNTVPRRAARLVVPRRVRDWLRGDPEA